MNVCEYIYMYREKTQSTDIERPQEWERERLQKTHLFLQALFHYLANNKYLLLLFTWKKNYFHNQKKKKKVFSNYDLK